MNLKCTAVPITNHYFFPPSVIGRLSSAEETTDTAGTEAPKRRLAPNGYIGNGIGCSLLLLPNWYHMTTLTIL